MKGAIPTVTQVRNLRLKEVKPLIPPHWPVIRDLGMEMQILTKGVWLSGMSRQLMSAKLLQVGEVRVCFPGAWGSDPGLEGQCNGEFSSRPAFRIVRVVVATLPPKMSPVRWSGGCDSWVILVRPRQAKISTEELGSSAIGTNLITALL